MKLKGYPIAYMSTTTVSRQWEDRMGGWSSHGGQETAMAAQVVSALALCTDDWLRGAGGAVPITALATRATANAAVVWRRPPQPTVVEVGAARVSPVALASRLATVASPLRESPLVRGAKRRGRCD
jgi:hypothetical protein